MGRVTPCHFVRSHRAHTGAVVRPAGTAHGQTSWPSGRETDRRAALPGTLLASSAGGGGRCTYTRCSLDALPALPRPLWVLGLGGCTQAIVRAASATPATPPRPPTTSAAFLSFLQESPGSPPPPIAASSALGLNGQCSRRASFSLFTASAGAGLGPAGLPGQCTKYYQVLPT